MNDLPGVYQIHFAPLQGYTDRIYRNIFARYFEGVDAYYTPFIRVESGGILRRKDLSDIDKVQNTVPCLIPQILPGSAEEFRLLVGNLRNNYSVVDINLGCPFPMIVKKGKGAGMLPYPERIKSMLKVIDEFPEVNFSVKMRLGWESTCECINLVDCFSDVRLTHIAIHARTGIQHYKGEPDLESFRKFYEKIHIPLFYNGDLKTRHDIDSILREFPALRGVLVGRGLLSSPFVAKEFKTNEVLDEKLKNEVCFKFHNDLFQAYSEVLQGEKQLLMKMQTMWDYFLPGTDKKWLKKIRKSNRTSDYLEAVNRIFYA